MSFFGLDFLILLFFHFEKFAFISGQNANKFVFNAMVLS